MLLLHSHGYTLVRSCAYKDCFQLHNLIALCI
jgi:hypothetical protein